MLTWEQPGERLGASVQLGSLLHDALGVGSVSDISCLPPLLSGAELARLEREKVTENSAKDDLCGAQASDGARSVAVLENGSDHFICVE